MLVTLEGIDGSGKTTVWEALQAEYPDATFTREPTDSWYGEAVSRSIGDDDADPLAELFLYTADHADHLSRVIEPALERDELVISDRYADSRYAYQGATLDGVLDRPMEYVRGIHAPFTIEPDLTLYFDLDPETGAGRAGATNKFERAQLLGDVRANYERLLEREPYRFIRLDATRPPETVIESAIDVLNEQIDARGPGDERPPTE
ncbi:thymidylate kinase [Halovivax asiaticus JCM 14624]|uniref:Probable thymidylate kinase n=1 Tax=Halovivax asiaticus JCM 14624 TaxID=1227490 RepID=M0BW92_9EURY|nr:dTMP kinase [Halovivax asiaticus]ELZ13919.1 thymidylate kinase [Halovivax asiaticus JCM 14624]